MSKFCPNTIKPARSSKIALQTRLYVVHQVHYSNPSLSIDSKWTDGCHLIIKLIYPKNQRKHFTNSILVLLQGFWPGWHTSSKLSAHSSRKHYLTKTFRLQSCRLCQFCRHAGHTILHAKLATTDASQFLQLACIVCCWCVLCVTLPQEPKKS